MIRSRRRSFQFCNSSPNENFLCLLFSFQLLLYRYVMYRYYLFSRIFLYIYAAAISTLIQVAIWIFLVIFFYYIGREHLVSFYQCYIQILVLGAQGIRATGFKRAQGNAHCAKFESHTNRVTFETNAIRMTSSVQALNENVILKSAPMNNGIC